MEADTPLECECGQLGDRVDGAVAVVTRGTDDRDRVLVDELRDLGHVGLHGHRVDRRAPALDREQVARLVERGVCGLGLDEVRAVDSPRLLRELAVREHRVQDAAAPARGDEPDRLAVGDRVGVEHVERHGDDLALELGHARAHVALQRVHVCEEVEGAPEELVVRVVAAVHRARALPCFPRLVLGVGEAFELGDDRVA